MNIQLDNILPAPLAEQDTSASEVWQKGLRLEAGKYIQFQAPSGKGKSTLLHILYGNRKDYSGNAQIGEKTVRRMRAGEWAKLRQSHFSMVFQDLRLFPNFTGGENIKIKSVLTHHYSDEEVKAMMERLGIAGLAGKKCGQMSFGERQRFAIVRALVQPFEWILLDEPFSHLDTRNAETAAALITEECHKRGAGLMVAGLNEDEFFDYHQKVLL